MLYSQYSVKKLSFVTDGVIGKLIIPPCNRETRKHMYELEPADGSNESRISGKGRAHVSGIRKKGTRS